MTSARQAILDQQLSALPGWQAPGFEPILAPLLAQNGGPIYVIGGAVRDFLLGQGAALADLDLALPTPVMDRARRAGDAAGWAFYPLDPERDVARLVEPGSGRVCDLAALRGSLDDDLRARDFPINALALALTPDQPPRLHDPTGGVDDLRAGRLRVWDAANLDADPVRLLRAVRMVHKFGLTLPGELAQAIRQRGASLAQPSPERIRDELWKILALAAPQEALTTLHSLGLLAHTLPELALTQGVAQSPPHHLDVYGHTLLTVAHAARLRDWLKAGDDSDPPPSARQALLPHASMLRAHFCQLLADERSRADWLVWHALVHDWGKPATRSVEVGEEGQSRTRFFGHEAVSSRLAGERLDCLRFSRREISLAQMVAAAHMRPHHLSASFPNGQISRRAAYRFFRDTASGFAGPRSGLDVLLLALADVMGTGAERGGSGDLGWADYLSMISQMMAFVSQPLPTEQPPLIDGHRLIRELQIPPGPVIGRLLDAIHEAQASGDIHSPEQALRLAEEMMGGDQGSGIGDQGSGIRDRVAGSGVAPRGYPVEPGQFPARIETNGAGTRDRGSGIGDRGSGIG